MCRALLTLAAVAMFAACSESVDPMGTDASLNFSNGPESPGPFVVREVEIGFFILFNDDRASRLVSLVRAPDPPGDVIPCGGGQGLDEADLQQVFHDRGAINMLLTGKDVSVHVYERAPFLAALFGGGLCNAMLTVSPLARGSGNFTAHDNDAFFSGTRTNAFGWSIRGTVVAAEGEEFRYHNEYHGAVASDGELRHLTSRITLTAVAGP